MFFVLLFFAWKYFKIVFDFLQVEEEETPADKGFEISRGGRGRTTRGQTVRRGISKYRQTQRKPRNTVRSSTHGGASGGLTDEIQLQEVSTAEK